MRSEKLTQPANGAAQVTRPTHTPIEIVHELRNCMSIVLLSIGNLDADLAHMVRDKRSIESLEKIIYKMNRLVEDLIVLFGEDKKKTGARRRRAYRSRVELPEPKIG